MNLVGNWNKMERRDFLRISAAACASASLAGCARAFNDGRTGLALIGCGRQGRDLTTNFLGVADPEHVRYVAVCDVDLRRAELARDFILEKYAEQGIAQEISVYSYPEQLLRQRDVDACVVAVADHNHTAVALDVVDAGCDLYLEKPITFTIEEGRELVRRVERKRAVFQSGTQQRSSLYFRRVCELVRQGKIGTLERVEIRLPQDHGSAIFEAMPVPEKLDYERWLGQQKHLPYTEKRVHPQADFSRPGWMQVEEFCHGMITNWGSHMIDIALWGSGREFTGPVSVRAKSTYEDRGIWNVHTRIEGEFTYADGLRMELLSLDAGDVRRPGVRFFGSEGWLDVVRGGFEAHDREILRWEPEPGQEILQVSKNHYEDFLNAVKSRKQPVSSAEVSHRSNTVCLLLAEAARSGHEIRWDPERERQV